jgi:hypothetical protein
MEREYLHRAGGGRPHEIGKRYKLKADISSVGISGKLTGIDDPLSKNSCILPGRRQGKGALNQVAGGITPSAYIDGHGSSRRPLKETGSEGLPKVYLKGIRSRKPAAMDVYLSQRWIGGIVNDL